MSTTECHSFEKKSILLLSHVELTVILQSYIYTTMQTYKL